MHATTAPSCVMTVGLAIVIGASMPSAQVVPQLPPSVRGQWVGPHELDPTEGDLYATQEIAHSMVLPPPADSQAPNQTRVVFFCAGDQPPCEPWDPGNDNYLFGRAYQWVPGRPTLLNPIALPPGFQQDGKDFFCGGQTFLSSGNLLFVCGTDWFEMCQSSGFVGHEKAWELDTRPNLPVWLPAVADLPVKRWYPTATLLPSGDVTVWGHTAGPNPPGTPQEKLRDTLAAGTWQQTDNVVPPCNTSDKVAVYDYPRGHISSSGYLVHTNTILRSGVSYIAQPTKFLDLLAPACPQPRWVSGQLVATNAPRLHGSSVHLITWDQGVFTEAVYVVGGATKDTRGVDGHEGDLICDTFLPSNYLDSVEKLSDSNLTPSTGWQLVDSLNWTRANHNTVMLLNGSLLVIGGMAVVDDPANPGSTICVQRKDAELYEPPEVFGGANPQWKFMAQQLTAREYHSVAGLLPNGEVFSAGGLNAEPGDETPDHSIEVYYPTYFFNGPRPEIQTPFLTGPYGYDTELEIEVQTAQADVDRVALVRNSTNTHAFDPDQRYVELAPNQPPEDLGGGLYRLRVQLPINGYTAPPGYYMLSVTDELDLPSPAVWIQIQ